jgi:putative intracellular protease/amidase
MDNTRRGLLGGIAAAAALAPLLTLQRAAAAEQKRVGSEESHEAMANHPGLKMYGDEVVGMLIYPGFTALDLVGPHYFFASMMGAKVHLVTNGKDLSPVASDLGLAVAPTITMAEAPTDLTILFAGGGLQGTLDSMGDVPTIDFIADRGSRATYVTSVCTGSLLLGQAGLLKGRRATSHWAARDTLTMFDAIPVNERVVTDGNVVTGAGVSAGLDFALALTAVLRGRGYAEALRLQAEYAPEPPVPGGTLETTDPLVAKLMQDMLAPFPAMVQKVAENRRR